MEKKVLSSGEREGREQTGGTVSMRTAAMRQHKPNSGCS